MDKEDVIFIYNGILGSYKNDELLSFARTWMDLEDIMLSRTEKDKNCTILLTCEYKTKKRHMNKQNKTHRYNQLVVIRGEGSRGEVK